MKSLFCLLVILLVAPVIRAQDTTTIHIGDAAIMYQGATDTSGVSWEGGTIYTSHNTFPSGITNSGNTAE